MGTYYIDQICGSRIGSNANPPSDQGEDPTDWNPSNKFWVGVRVRCSNSTKATVVSTITLRWRVDTGGWTTLASTGQLKWPGTGNMVFTDLTPANANWFCGAIDCGLTDCTDGVAQDNSASLSASLDSCELELWWAIDPAGMTGSFFEFAIYDDNAKFGTESSPTLLACSVTKQSEAIQVDCTHVSITLTDYLCTLDLPMNFQVGTQAITQTVYPATVQFDTKIDAGTVAITSTAYQCTLDMPMNFQAGTQALTLTTYQADVYLYIMVLPISTPDVELVTTPDVEIVGIEGAVDVNVDCTHVSITLTSYQTDINEEVEFTAGYVAIALTSYQADINAKTEFTATCVSIVLSAYQSDVNAKVEFTASYASIALTAHQCTLDMPMNFDMGIDALVLTAYNPTVDWSANVVVDCSVVNIVLTSYQSDINAEVEFTTQTVGLVQTVYAAVVNLDVPVAAQVVNIVLTAYQAEINAKIQIDVQLDSLVLTAYQADINAKVSIEANYVALILTVYGVDINEEIEVEVDIDALILTVYNPTVDYSILDIFVDVGVVNIVLITYDATIDKYEEYFLRNRGFLLGGIYGRT